MRRLAVAATMAAAAAAASCRAPSTPHRAASTPIRRVFERQVDDLASHLDTLARAIADSDRSRAVAAYVSARIAYKRSETLLWTFGPSLARELIGPIESDDPDLPPGRLGAPAMLARAGAFARAAGPAPGFSATVRRIQAFRGELSLLSIGDSALLDAARLEIARLATEGIAGTDVTPGTAADEERETRSDAAAALDGLADLLDARRRDPALVAMVRHARTAVTQREGDAGAFNRLAFIVGHVTPIARAIARARDDAGIGPSRLRRVWRSTSSSVFDRDAFDPSAYAPEFAPALSGALVALGRALFFDPALSGPGTRSCASCHVPDRAFTDGLPRPVLLDHGARSTARNTPTLVNAALQPVLFLDGRAGSLEDQVAQVLRSDAEMRSSPELAAARAGANRTRYAALAAAAFGPPPADSVTPLRIRVALAAYLRTLVALDSRADRAWRGDTLALTPVERHGFAIYMGAGRCGRCHVIPLTGGARAPVFDAGEFEVIGVPRVATTAHAMIDPDSGRARVDHAPTHAFAFRTPSLRNVALTAPYMHNGAYATLESVVDFYDRGGGAGIGVVGVAQTLDAAPLHLAPMDRTALVAFLRALTDTSVGHAR